MMFRPSVHLSARPRPRLAPAGWARLGVFLLASAAALATGHGALAFECGDSGNLYWTYSQPNAGPGRRTAALDSARVFWADGSALVELTKDGVLLTARDFLSFGLGRPLVVDTQHGGHEWVCVAASDGYVYAFDAEGLSTQWSRSLRRPTCSSDGLHQSLALQLWDLSDATYRAAMSTDLVIAGTRFACSTTTANRVYALDGANGSTRWVFNATGGYQVDAVSGLAVDYTSNLVYVTTEKDDPTQASTTVFALRTTNGSRLWGADRGSIAAPPLLAGDALYIVSHDGLLSKLDPGTGVAIWSLQATTDGRFVTQEMSYSPSLQRLFLTAASNASDGVLIAVDDLGSAGQVAWQTVPSGPGALGAVESAPVVLDGAHAVYVGVSYRGAVQLGACQGILQHLPESAYPVDDLVIESPSSQPRLYAATGGSAISKLCIPQPPTLPGGRQDADDDGTVDCLDGCPDDPLKTEPGQCGCGLPDLGDCALPQVTVTGPNGGGACPIGTQVPLTWTASDNVGVTTVDLRLSRDGGTVFETIALGELDDGVFDWLVTGPTTTQARLEVTAHDAAGGTAADLSDANWAIVTQSFRADGGTNSLGVYFDADTFTRNTIAPTPFVGFHMYFVLANCQWPAISGFEFSWQLDPVPSESQCLVFAATLPPGGENLLSGQSFVVTLPAPLPTGAAVVLADVALFPFVPDIQTHVRVGPVGSASIPGRGAIANGSGPVQLAPLEFAAAGCGDVYIDAEGWTVPGIATINLPPPAVNCIGWGNLQAPLNLTAAAGAASGPISGRVWVEGVTGQPGATEGLLAQVGYGPDGSDPLAEPGAWQWFATTFSLDAGGSDEYVGSITVAAPGRYDYGVRYSLDEAPWVYGDADSSTNGYSPAQAGDLVVTDMTDVPSPDPTAWGLHPSRPNPFNPSTAIPFDLPAAGRVRLAVYDVRGRLVRTLVDASLPEGAHQAAWDGRDTAGRAAVAGVYFARLEAGGGVETVRMSLIR